MALVRELLTRNTAASLSGDLRARLKKWSEPFTAERAGVPPDVLRSLAAELAAKPALAVTGGVSSSDEHGLATALAVNLLNVASGAINNTVTFDRSSPLDHVATRAQVETFQGAMAGGSLQAVVITDANPVYSSPGFHSALEKVPFVVALSSFPDETTEAAHVTLPIHTPLESWGDDEPWTGLYSLQQPATEPLFPTREPGDLLMDSAKSLGRAIAEQDFREFLRARWRRIHRESGSKDDFESFWVTALERGGYWRSVPNRPVALKGEGIDEHLGALLQPAQREGYRLLTYPSIAHFDGRGANRPWLQELPDPITQVVWDTWVEIHPQDATKLGVARGDAVRLTSAHGQVELPVYVYPGVQPGTVAVPLGQGHTSFGRWATGVGANVMALLNSSPDPAADGLRWSGERIRIEALGAKRALVTIAGHFLQEHREIARSRTVPRPSAAPAEEPHEALSLYPPQEYKSHRWGMTIDLDACTACGACIIACYTENNVPVVGKAEVARGREMSWIRVEPFYGPGASISKPFQIDFVLMLCQHCDNAPCEPVCPVFAAYHNAEGLNGQVYNRCVGTRYCANNCPYKVRRFNWYEADWPAPLNWQLNPDVTARTKGVMEKCSFCIQRIVAAKDRARREGRPLADGDAVTACAQSCPAQAIIFGDLNDPRSRVRQALQNERRYKILGELNTQPAVTYLERERRTV